MVCVAMQQTMSELLHYVCLRFTDQYFPSVKEVCSVGAGSRL